MKESSLKSPICPVPLEQQPIYEYEQLKESWFFRWATLNNVDYAKILISIAFWGGLFASVIAYASFPFQKYPLAFSLSVIIGALFFSSLVAIQFYLAWRYVGDRLAKDTIFYEESGWYDGQKWQKPENMMNRDLLIVEGKIKPILQRLKTTIFSLLTILSLIIIVLVIKR